MKKYIHINQHIIRRNKSNGYNEPVITVKTYKSNNYGHSVEVNGPCTIVYSPDKPLSCGARVWIETDASVTVVDAVTCWIYEGGCMRIKHNDLGLVFYQAT
jgi:hypothetical protein